MCWLNEVYEDLDSSSFFCPSFSSFPGDWLARTHAISARQGLRTAGGRERSFLSGFRKAWDFWTGNGGTNKAVG